MFFYVGPRSAVALCMMNEGYVGNFDLTFFLIVFHAPVVKLTMPKEITHSAVLGPTRAVRITK